MSICLEVYELDPVRFLTAPGLAWQAALKKTKVKLHLLTYIGLLLMGEKYMKSGKNHAIYAKVNSKYMKNHENKESSVKCWGVNNKYRWAMSQKLP